MTKDKSLVFQYPQKMHNNFPMFFQFKVKRFFLASKKFKTSPPTWNERERPNRTVFLQTRRRQMFPAFYPKILQNPVLFSTSRFRETCRIYFGRR